MAGWLTDDVAQSQWQERIDARVAALDGAERVGAGLMADEEMEFTSRERGLLAGHRWAEAQARAHDDVAEVARTGVAPHDVRASELDTDDAFWEGFIHGVRAFVVELEIGGGSN
jgi:hypothetical protein